MADRLAAAVRALEHGEIVLYPTDTLLGLAVSATDATALGRLVDAKDRPGSMPISVAISSLEEAEPLVDWSNEDRAKARRWLPGPVTVLVRASVRARRNLAAPLVAADGSLGLRVPDHPIARELARRAGPITSTSANRHGGPPCTTVRQAHAVFGARIAVYLPAEPAPSGTPSTLLDLRAPSRS